MEKFLAFEEEQEYRSEDRKGEFEMDEDTWFPDDMGGYEHSVPFRTILKGKLK